MTRADKKSVIFIANLLQDANVFRSLLYLLGDTFDLNLFICITKEFVARDSSGFWMDQISLDAEQTCAAILQINSLAEFSIFVAGLQLGGCVIASSESKLPASGHKESRLLLDCVPKSNFSTVTLQHGHECIGFLHNAKHTSKYSDRVGFSSDYVCCWGKSDYLLDCAPTSRAKLLETGNPLRILKTRKRPIPKAKGFQPIDTNSGIVCENLHSARFEEESISCFLDFFNGLATHLQRRGKILFIRPHPAGQYLLNNSYKLPANAYLDTSSIISSAWRGYTYAISPPSSVIYDFATASIPCAIYQDKFRSLDISNYKDFPVVDTLESAISFVESPTEYYTPIVESPSLFQDSDLIASNYIRLFSDLLECQSNYPHEEPAACLPSHGFKRYRILIISPDSQLPSAHICLKIPLESCDFAAVDVHDSKTLKAYSRSTVLADAFNFYLLNNRIDFLILCRAYDSDLEQILAAAKNHGIPSIYFMDDDLLNPCPISIGKSKYKKHGNPSRIAMIKRLLERVDLVYASTNTLRTVIANSGFHKTILCTQINCSPLPQNLIRSIVSTLPPDNAVIGYTGFGHAADFAVASHALEILMDEYPFLKLEIIGTVVVPESLQKYTDRITIKPPDFSYQNFMKMLSESGWSVGICPLARTSFNECKSINKWVEYASSKIPVVATSGLIYDTCISGDAGILCDDTVESWYHALKLILTNPDTAKALAENAFYKVCTHYSQADHSDQILSVLRQAKVEHAKNMAIYAK